MAESTLQLDLAGKDHWDRVYQTARTIPQWSPTDYASICLDQALTSEIERAGARTVLEVGGGNSVWLPYLLRKPEITAVTGLDYSEAGCRLLSEQLTNERGQWRVICQDLFAATPEEIGTHDFVFSLGVVEHFADTAGVLAKLLTFVRPGGVLFTEVPNLFSIHGLMTWAWQPELLAKHVVLRKRHLVSAYQGLGLDDVHGYYSGVFGLHIVSWENYPRWPALVPIVTRAVRAAQARISQCLSMTEMYRGVAPTAPYLCVAGRKPMKGAR